jgi:hypothetical protein
MRAFQWARSSRTLLSAVAFLASSSIAAPLMAQGNLSTQGFGYPSGQLSTRSLSVGGALGEFDAQSPINPAAIGLGLRASVYMQFDPEFRTTKLASRSISATTMRFPVFAATGRFNDFTFGLSFSQFLDRSWNNTYTDTQVVRGEPIASRLSASSTGGVSDVRGAAAWSIGTKLTIGAALHYFPGENKILLGRDFADSLKIGNFTEARTLTYSGAGYSLGVVAQPFEHLTVAASGRIGTNMDVRVGDSTVLGQGKVPTRVGAAIGYDGISGSLLSVRWNSEKWSDLKGLGSTTLPLHDATELSAGIESNGPKIGALPSVIRLGIRSRELPFSATTTAVKESSFTGGFGIPVASGRGILDLGVANARRTAGSLKETGWTVSVGLSIKP